MKFWQRMAKQFLKLRKQLQKRYKAIIALAAVVVFVTTYALILPAVTEDTDTAASDPALHTETVAGQSADNGGSADGTSSGSATLSNPETTESKQEDAAAETTEGTGTTAEETAAPSEDLITTDGTQLNAARADGQNFSVWAVVNADAKLNADTVLSASEIAKDADATKDTYAAYFEKATAAMNEVKNPIVDAHFYDISFTSASKAEDNGIEEPAADVKTTIQFDNPIALTTGQVIRIAHIDQNGNLALLDTDKVTFTNTSDNKIGAVTFTANQFSVYGVVVANPEQADSEKNEEENKAESQNTSAAEITENNTESESSSTEKAARNEKGTAGEPEATVGNVTFKVSYDENAGLPEGTTLVVRSVKADDYTDATKDVLGDIKIAGEKYFDISFEHDGQKIEPKAEVSVTVTLSGEDNLTAGNDVKIVHFAGGKDQKPEVIDANVEGGKTEAAASAAKQNILVSAIRKLAPKKTNSGSNSIVTFKSDSFSVYGVVETEDKTKPTNYRRTYIFQNDNGSDYEFTLTDNPDPKENKTPVNQKTNQQIVKSGGQLLDVGIPVSTKNSEKEFLGWGVVTDGTVDTTNLIKLPYTVSGLTGDDSVTLRAVYSDQIKITFYDVDNETILHTVKAKPESALDLSKYEAVPKSSEQGFLGWATTKNATTALDNGYTVPDKDTSLYPVIATGHWLRFNKNDNDNDPTEATYTNPVFVTGEVTEKNRPTSPTRTGYTFGGWYETKECNGEPYSFSGELAKSKTLYAKWTPNQVNYRVVYWEENPDDYGFSYYRSGKLTGIAGQKTEIGNIELTDADGGNIVQGFHHHSSDADEDHRTDAAHLAHKTEDVAIKGDGTTVVNVYFDRDIYAVKFVKASSSSAGSWNNLRQKNQLSGKYNLVKHDPHTWRRDEYYFETAENGTYSADQVWNYTSNNTVYIRTGASSSEETINDLTITAKYGASIADKWPSRRTDVTNPDTKRAYPVNWKVSPSSNDNTYQANLSTMPLNGFTFYYSAESTGNTMNINYYVQSVNGGNSFSRDHIDSFSSSNSKWNTTKEDYYDLRGFKPIFRDANQASGMSEGSYVTWTNTYGENHWSANVGSGFSQVDSNTYEVNFYYARIRYDITFTPNDDKSDFTDRYYYQQSIANAAPSGYTKGKTTKTGSNGDTLTFAGWYDNEDCLGDEYVFTGKTMPANGIHLYAKWVPSSYTVTVNPNGGKFADGTTANKVTENVPFGTVISENDYRNPTRDGYEFIGWYLQNANGTETVYDFETSVTSNVTLKAHWRKTGSFGVRYINTDPTKTPADDGAQLKVDPYSYADQAEVKVLEAPKSNEIPNGYEFIGWSYEGNTYASGDTITLDASKATKVDGLSGQYVTLKAMYTKLNTTWLKYDANGGDGTLTNPEGILNNQQVNIPMNTQVTLSSGAGFTRIGYKLIGWNTKADGQGIHWDLSDKAGIDGVEGNTLYAEWAPVYVTVSFTKKGEQSGTEEPKTLAGAQFSLSNGTTDPKTAISGEDGSVSFTGEKAVQAPTTENGKIELSETSAPDGYEVAQGSPWTVTYDVAKATKADDGKYYVAGTIKKGDEEITEIIDPISKTDITIVKEDQSDNRLIGAAFTLKFKGKDGTKDIAAKADSGLDEDGKFTVNKNDGITISGLPVGQYVLTENTAPDGYIINTSDIEFTVTKDGVDVKEGTDTKLATASGKTLTVKNAPGQALPSTGGHGTLPYTFGGLAIIAMAGLMYGFVLKKNKKMN